MLMKSLPDPTLSIKNANFLLYLYTKSDLFNHLFHLLKAELYGGLVLNVCIVIQ